MKEYKLRLTAGEGHLLEKIIKDKDITVEQWLNNLAIEEITKNYNGHGKQVYYSISFPDEQNEKLKKAKNNYLMFKGKRQSEIDNTAVDKWITDVMTTIIKSYHDQYEQQRTEAATRKATIQNKK